MFPVFLPDLKTNETIRHRVKVNHPSWIMVQCEKPAALSEGTPVSSQWQRAGTLGLLTLCYTLGELGHFLIATTSKQVANSLQFGDLRCYVDHKAHLSNVTNDVCMGVKTQVPTSY